MHFNCLYLRVGLVHVKEGSVYLYDNIKKIEIDKPGGGGRVGNL